MKDIPKLILNSLVIFIFLLNSITFVNSGFSIVKKCPIVSGYLEVEFGSFYECMNKGNPSDPGWYLIDSEGNFERVSSSAQGGITNLWVENNFKVRNKEDIIQNGGINLGSYVDGIFTLNFIEENSYFNLNDVSFKNILPENEDNEFAYITLNFEDEEIVEANFMVNENGGDYTFEGITFYAFPYSKITFDKENGVEVVITDKTDLSNFLELFENSGESSITILGENLTFPDGFNLIEGKLTIDKNGYTLEDGEVLYRQNLLTVREDEDNNILIANQDTDLSDYEGNWIKQTSDILELQSAKDGIVEIEFLENHEILNTDNKDGMSVVVSGGDGLEITNRDRMGVIPTIKHKSSEYGDTIIYNDKFEFDINKDEFTMSPPVDLSDEDFSTKYQSVALEVESDSLSQDTKLRINSYRQFTILSKDNRELVSYNKDLMPVSAMLEDNSLQTLDQMIEKYPEIEFNIPRFTPFDEENIPPYLLYATDTFLKDSPEATDVFDKVEFSNIDNAFARGNILPGEKFKLGLGLKAIYTEGGYSRKMISPMQIFTHEYEHGKNFLITAKEIEYLTLEGDRSVRLLLDEDDVNYDIGWATTTHNNNNPKKKTLYGVYERIIRESESDFIKNEDVTEPLSDLVEGLSADYTQKKLDEILFEVYGEDMKSYVANLEGYRDLPKYQIYTMSDSELRNIAFKNLEDTYDKNSGDDSGYWWGEIAQASYINWKANSIIDDGWNSEIADMYIALPFSDATEIDKIGLNYRNKLDEFYEKATGVPSLYAAYDSVELSTTFIEQTVEDKIMKVNSVNKAVSEMYTKLTQVAFDSGSMDLTEYKAIMGDNYCKKDDCSDKICSEYKLLCCADYPKSRNC